MYNFKTNKKKQIKSSKYNKNTNKYNKHNIINAGC